jgi:hypothetical protein
MLAAQAAFSFCLFPRSPPVVPRCCKLLRLFEWQVVYTDSETQKGKGLRTQEKRAGAVGRRLAVEAEGSMQIRTERS